jgi:rfaE bifunctional protein nucleotidyltransferase chain/domain
VCLNSDASVRRLKGRGRPVNCEADRAAVLLGLSCVDSVLVFDEDTPCAALARIRPELFAKGADYEGRHVPEARALSEWGGRLILLPLVEGRSTSSLVRAVESTA